MTIRLECPIPIQRYPRITLAHGGGGRLTADLVRMFRAAFPDEGLNGDDAARIRLDGPSAFTSDAFVVTPRFFPGGSLGTLAVFGIVNDLACVGARARFLSMNFVLEEGLEIAELWRLACEIGDVARQVGVQIVAGDTKVVERGKGDGVYVSASGIGEVIWSGPHAVEDGDQILVSGDLARHGMAVMLARDALGISAEFESDCASIWPLVEALISSGVSFRRVRDLTRGGLATCLNELAADAERCFVVDETRVPVRSDVAGACGLLGLDPLYVANEGTCAVIVSADDAEAALAIAQEFRDDARIIGHVEQGRGVVARNALGTRRVLDVLSGMQLPRIC